MQAAPRRTLRLTSPNTKGEDVRRLQVAINDRLAARGRARIKVDGQYGKATADAFRKVLYLLGCPSKNLELGALARYQRIVRNPKLRPPYWYPIVRDREKYLAAQHDELDKFLEWCRLQVGTKEHPPMSNRGPRIDDWQRGVHMLGQAWCAAFLIYGLRRICGMPLPDYWRFTPYILTDAQLGRFGAKFHPPTATPKRGWLVLYDFYPGGDPVVHVGVVYDPTPPSDIETIEGNTSDDDAGSQDNGGVVARKHRRGFGVVGFVELPYGT